MRTSHHHTEDAETESTLTEVFLEELADVYHAEKQITKALPKMIKAAQSDELREALEEHLEQTEGQIERLDEVFAALDQKVKTKTCKGMQGIVEEGDETIKENKNTPAIDAVIISAAQKVEHYEIASYGTLAAWAEQMGNDEAARLLHETLREEKDADEKLTEIAESLANQEAEA
ncbi:MAG TPA: ferritin-like domain-containing protein [Verrucomicrobiae bacterium]|nr:ferritin-like domain-containing protein [Verrucomicrobiae bacterium]